jgi:hypothetical protein
MSRSRVSSLVLIGMVVLFAVSAFAQYSASIQGTVTEATGAVVQGATVVVTNQATNVPISVTTGDSGLYRVAQLPPGKYTVTVTAPSFKKSESKDIVVSAESPRGFNVKLELGPATEAVTVSAQGQQLETETANSQATISTLEILDLPQFGRDPYNLVRTTPGVFGEGARNNNGNSVSLPQQVGPGGSNSQIFQTENQIQAVSNGQRVSANNILLDGVSVNSLDWGGAAVITPNQESVAEVTVVASSYSAEDGRNSGIIIKGISKSGTNNLHGSGVIKFNDKGLNAFNKFYGPTTGTIGTVTCETGTPSQFTMTAANCPERVDQKYRQFAGSLGGPIIKNHLFFFASYEGLRSNSSTLNRNVKMETPQFDSYIISKNPNSIAAKIVGTPGYAARIVNTISTKDCCSLDGRANGTWYVPGVGIGQAIGNGPDGIPDWGVFDIRVPNNQIGNQFNGRLDYNTGMNQFFGSSYFVGQDNLSGGQRAIEDLTFKPNSWIGTLGWITQLNSSMVNDLRGNFTRWGYDQLTPTGQTNYGIPQIRLFDFDAGGLGDIGRFIGIGQSSTTPASLAQNTFSIRDTLSWVHGRHAFKFGVEAIKEQNNNNQSGASRPDYQFRGLLNFANDACCFFEGVAVNPNTGGPANGLRHFRTSDYALFVDDSWKIRSNLTLTLGLRWEYFPPYAEKNDQLTNYVFGTQGVVNGSVKAVSQLSNPDRNNFGPKIGIAWAPFNDGSTVFRGGVGVSYNRDFGVVFGNVRQNTPFQAQVGDCCFFDPGAIQGPPPGSGMLYSVGTSTSAFSYPVNPAFAFGVAPDGALCANAGCTSVTKVDIFGSPQNQPTPYVYSYSLEMEQAFGKRDALRLGYYGSLSRKLVRTIDQNRLIPGDTFDNTQDQVQNASANGVACGPTNPACPAPVPTANPRFNRIFFPTPDVNASYNAMVVNWSHRSGYGLSFNTTYTWSHTIDTASFDVGFQQTDPSNQLLDKGNSDFDVRHNFVASAVWELPYFRGRHDLMGTVLGGWMMSGVLSKHSGFPFSALIGSCNTAQDRNGDSYCPDLPFSYSGGMIVNPSTQQWINGVFPTPATSFNTTTRGPGCRCRNIFTGPGYTDFDLTLGKNFGLPKMKVFGEGAKLEVRANAFNALNTLNLKSFAPATAQTDIANTGSFGKASDAYSGRVIELQVRFSF